MGRNAAVCHTRSRAACRTTVPLITLRVRLVKSGGRLKKHHASRPGPARVLEGPHGGQVDWRLEDTVREALSFGWIDSLVKRLDDDRYALEVTRRKRTSR
jgi:hypothetical protein